MVGYIYIIKNDLNDKVYIGQTRVSIEDRFYRHKLAAKQGKLNSKLYDNMKNLGIEHFYTEQLIECDVKDLNKYEQYYVEKYDSIRNGYNTIYPCGSYGKTPVRDYIDKAIEMYCNGSSYAEIAKACNISEPLASRVIKETGIEKVETKRKHGSQKIELVVYTDKFVPIMKLDSIADAYKYIHKNTEFSASEYGVYNYINVACKNGNIAYGHRWQLCSDLTYEDKVFRTKFDKEAYINGSTAYQPEEKQYWVCDDAFNNLKTLHNTENYCTDCGKRIPVRKTLCKECRIKNRETYIQRTNKIKPDKEQLQQLLEQYSYEEIGRQFGVTGKSVRKWCEYYNIRKQTNEMNRDTSGVTCVELNVHFNTFADAAKFMISNKFTDNNNIYRYGYKISVAKRNKKTCGGFHWT